MMMKSSCLNLKINLQRCSQVLILIIRYYYYYYHYLYHYYLFSKATWSITTNLVNTKLVSFGWDYTDYSVLGTKIQSGDKKHTRNLNWKRIKPLRQQKAIWGRNCQSCSKCASWWAPAHRLVLLPYTYEATKCKKSAPHALVSPLSPALPMAPLLPSHQPHGSVRRCRCSCCVGLHGPKARLLPLKQGKGFPLLCFWDCGVCCIFSLALSSLIIFSS